MNTNNLRCPECETGNISTNKILKVESSMIKITVYTLLFLILVEIIAYYGFFRKFVK